MSTAAQQSRPFQRAVRKVKCAMMVNSLAKSWQSWVNENSNKQSTIPSGWTPDSISEEEERKEKERSEVKLLVTLRVVVVDGSDGGNSKIRTGTVTKSVERKHSDCGKDVVGSIKEKIDTNQMAPAEGVKPFLGNESPTRRRLAKALGQAGQEDRKMGSRSSSLDTEDSGLGEEAALSDISDQAEEKQKKHVSRSKIKVDTMGDLKSRWQQWSEKHMEGQKLNPFSEEFDYEHSISKSLKKGDAGYGRPEEGSKTAQRADRAIKHIRREMEEMCFIIRDFDLRDRNGNICITFGRLFDRYVKISDKVVGILLRCRKHKMVAFEGEMLWKGQDDDVIITLLDH